MEQGTATMDSVLHAGITARGFGDQVKKLVNHSLLQMCFILNNQDSSSCIFCCDCFQMLKSLQTLVSTCMETAERHTLTRDAQAGMQSKALQLHIFTARYCLFLKPSLVVFGYRDQSCGQLFCSGGWEFPVTSRKSLYKVGNGDMCNVATMNPEDNYPEDLDMVPTGTKCGKNMVRKLLFVAKMKKTSMRYRFLQSLCVSFRYATINSVKT